jgi:ABC-2 type transport system permease protein
VPMLIVVGLVADSFAGERERHTLETLLASRLPDRAILFGKIVAIGAYSWLASIAVFILGSVTVNIAHSGHHGTIRFTAAETAAALSLSLMTTTIATTIGALISLRAETVRQAQQVLTVGVVITAMIPGFGGELLPAGLRDQVRDAIEHFSVTTVMYFAIIVLAAIALILLRIASGRFQRSQLLAN